MQGNPPTKAETCFGIWAAIQGGILMGVSGVALHAALPVAEIAYAEDFDTPEGAPSWFGIWRLAMLHPYLTTSVFSLTGALLVAVGLLFAKRGQPAQRALDWSLTLAATCIGMLLIALIPLSNIGRNWGVGTLARDLRYTLVWGSFAAWFELATLLASIAIARRLPKMSKGARQDR